MATMLQASSDERIQRAVLDELHQSLLVNAADIGVRVHGGIVTLTGYVPSYHKARAAEEAALRVPGVHGVANEVVSACPLHSRDDEEIAREVTEAIDRHIVSEAIDRGIECHPGCVTASVSDGWVTLRGAAAWHCQLLALERVARDVSGVTGVSNLLEVSRQVPEQEWFRL